MDTNSTTLSLTSSFSCCCNGGNICNGRQIITIIDALASGATPVHTWAAANIVLMFVVIFTIHTFF
jgi:hypothetical protein